MDERRWVIHVQLLACLLKLELSLGFSRAVASLA